MSAAGATTTPSPSDAAVLASLRAAAADTAHPETFRALAHLHADAVERLTATEPRLRRRTDAEAFAAWRATFAPRTGIAAARAAAMAVEAHHGNAAGMLAVHGAVTHAAIGARRSAAPVQLLTAPPPNAIVTAQDEDHWQQRIEALFASPGAVAVPPLPPARAPAPAAAAAAPPVVPKPAAPKTAPAATWAAVMASIAPDADAAAAAAAVRAYLDRDTAFGTASIGEALDALALLNARLGRAIQDAPDAVRNDYLAARRTLRERMSRAPAVVS